MSRTEKSKRPRQKLFAENLRGEKETQESLIRPQPTSFLKRTILETRLREFSVRKKAPIRGMIGA